MGKDKEDKEVKLCCACKDKLEKDKQGLRHSNTPSNTLPQEHSDPGLKGGQIFIKECRVCGERVVSNYENYSDHDCQQTHLEKHLVPNFLEDDSKKHWNCLFCQMKFNKKDKTKCSKCKRHYYEEPKKAECQKKHEAFKKYFPNHEREREQFHSANQITSKMWQM